jgi:DNA polymerase-4
LRHLFGHRLPAVQKIALGIDPEPVVADRDAKSLSHETTFDEDTDDLAFLEETLRGFLSELSHELRVQGLASRIFTIKLKDSRFQITTRQQQFPGPLNYDPDMWPAIRNALGSLILPRIRYRLIGLGLSGLAPVTTHLFDHRREKAIAALDALMTKHGTSVLRLGGLPDKSHES